MTGLVSHQSQATAPREWADEPRKDTQRSPTREGHVQVCVAGVSIELALQCCLNLRY